ncbi:hypothetical protein VNO77_03697 [Canavalia gladiata]|uniref:Uncharacterized protein n=1 Tax=Canavalia gladiata TaxID=3824 RepID=A0AAN9R733_CANGL
MFSSPLLQSLRFWEKSLQERVLLCESGKRYSPIYSRLLALNGYEPRSSFSPHHCLIFIEKLQNSYCSQLTAGILFQISVVNLREPASFGRSSRGISELLSRGQGLIFRERGDLENFLKLRPLFVGSRDQLVLRNDRGSPYPYADPVELALLFSLQFSWEVSNHGGNDEYMLQARAILCSEDDASHSIIYDEEELVELHACDCTCPSSQECALKLMQDFRNPTSSLVWW